jgi:outer membrane protein with beta-barrel domain
MSRMRRSVVSVVTLVCLTLISGSAAHAAETWFGPIAGLNIANMDIEGRSGLNVRTTFAIGGAVDVGFGNRFGMRIEPMYVSKGTKANEYNAYWATVNQAVIAVDYANLGLLARLNLSNAETRGYLLGGLGIGAAINKEVEISQGNVTEKVDFSDVFGSTDITIDLGAGVSFPVGTNRLTLDGRVAFGVVDVNEGGTVTFDGAPLTVPDTATKTLDFRILASYLFPWPGN